MSYGQLYAQYLTLSNPNINIKKVSFLVLNDIWLCSGLGVSSLLSAINDRLSSVMGRWGGFAPPTVCQLADIFQLLFLFISFCLPQRH